MNIGKPMMYNNNIGTPTVKTSSMIRERKKKEHEQEEKKHAS